MDLRRTSPTLTRQQKLGVVSVEEVKAQARVRHSTEDELIAGYIVAAFDHLHGPEGWLNGYCLLPEVYEIYSANFGADYDLPLRPLRQVLDAIEIGYRDAAGSYVAVDPGLYYLSHEFGSGRIARTPNSIWPVQYSAGHALAYRLTIKVGHDTPEEVPEPIRMGIKLLAAHWYANREAVALTNKALLSIPYGLTALCGRFRYAHDHS